MTATTTPAPEEKSFADYILILPAPDLPPIYIYLSKPPVEFLEVELYSDFKRWSRQGKYEADHMPSAAAVRAYLKQKYPKLDSKQLDRMAEDVAAIVIPKEAHQKISETYGGRNKPAQIELDSRNLRAALDRNLDTIKPALKEHGATEGQIEVARAKMHKLNRDMGLYK
ncbi:S-type pyocin domain-containing protein [Tenebrionicola larvae]|nr:S-type pyocin domain-containing protein [Tenebrionicola larvae]